MEAKELLAKYAAGERDFRGAFLQSAWLANATLQETLFVDAWMVGSFLQGADFRRANLQNADLNAANLSCTNFAGANLSGADLTSAWLVGANFKGADLVGAKVDNDKVIDGLFTRTNIGKTGDDLLVAYNQRDIWLKMWSSGWLTPDEFLTRFASAPKSNLYTQIYNLTVAHIIEIVKLERCVVQRS